MLYHLYLAGQACLCLSRNVFRKRHLIFVAVFLLPIFATANYPIIPRPTDRKLGSTTVIDSSYIQVFYAFNADDPKNMDTYEDYQCLEVGKKHTKYHSVFLERGEQKVGDWLKKHHGASSMPFACTDGKRGTYWSEYQYTELYTHDNKLTGYYCFPMHLSQYNAICVEDFPAQKWVIKSGMENICGMLCQKAVCHFRGRDFTAWFAADIPVKHGPWKFGGLPGLILKVSDSSGQYTFECVKIEKKKKPLCKHAFNNYTNRKRTDIVKLQRLINQNYLKVVGVKENVDLPFVGNASYKPLELE